jgi:hypothetical protein
MHWGKDESVGSEHELSNSILKFQEGVDYELNGFFFKDTWFYVF